MNIFFILTFLFTLPFCLAQQKTNTISRQEEEIITQTGPQEDSPFLIERQDAQQAAAAAATNTIYRNSLLTPRHSLQQQLRNFGRDMFGFVNLSSDKKNLPAAQLFIEPSAFSVTEIPELNISFKITNNKKRMLMLEFSTNQRIDILVKDAHGSVLSRWSEDRTFDSIPGIVTINPKESVFYTEKIPTSMMHDGEAYVIEASVVGHPEFTLSQKITPQYAASQAAFDE